MKRRLLFGQLLNHLEKKQISLIIGARQTGKTTLMLQLKEEVEGENQPCFFISLEDLKILTLLNQHPDYLFQVLPPLNVNKRSIIFIDEIQYLDNPSNFLKYHYDKSLTKIKFIVSGSSSFYIDEKFKDSLAGRKRIFKLPTLSFEEFIIFQDREELLPFLNKGPAPEIYKNELLKLQGEYMVFGGYPDVVTEPEPKEKQLILMEIAESYVKKDALETGLKHPDAYLNILSTLAEIVGSLLNTNNIAVKFGLSNMTVNSYIRLMQKSFHIATVKPFYRNISKELKKMPKVFFTDLGLRNHFLNNFTPLLLRDNKVALLENFVFRLFSDRVNESYIKFWRTQKQQEVDFIIKNKRAFEVKFNKTAFKPAKYDYFTAKYPNISLELIHFENVLDVNLTDI